jgi:transcriptional regulator with XRE-family HTH domain
MTSDELKALRLAIDITQFDMAQAMGLALRLYQDLENGKKPLKVRHTRTAERVSLQFAVWKKKPMLALPSIRQEALELVDMIRGHKLVNPPSGKLGQFQLVELELGDYGELISRKVVPEPFRTREEAEKMAERAARSHRGAHGFNEENGYWWGRDLKNRVYRFIVEAI